MTKEEKIICVVTAFNSGESLQSLLQRFKCSKSWLYKWVNKYKANPAGAWYTEQSRRPNIIRTSTSDQEKQAIIDAEQQILTVRRDRIRQWQTHYQIL